MDYSTILENVPDYQVFLTVDEMDESSLKLKEEYPDLVDLSIIGYSRKKHPIYCLKIGKGEKNALMFGCPHPNEPMGAMMLEYFSRALCENDDFRNQCGYTWYLIKCIDIDGTKLNEGWFKGPFNLTNYARDFFRPTSYEQVEWTFPIEYKQLKFDKPLPETLALMKLIDEIKPDFMYSLHNAGFGGAYWYISEDLPELWDKLYHAATSRHMPLSLGEPEAPYITAFAPAIFKNTGIEEDYDYVEKFSEEGCDLSKRFECGTSSNGYAQKYGTISLVGELPYFYSPKIESDAIMDFTRKEAIIQGAKIKLDEYNEINEYYQMYKEFVSSDNPFTKMVEMMLNMRQSSYEESLKYVESDDKFNEPCKESEAFDSLEITRFYTLLTWGLLVRGAKFESTCHEGDIAKRLEEVASILEEKMMAKAGAVESIGYSLVPIQTLVRIQLESGLIVSSYIQEKGK
ncbi:MAG: M14 family zinc carboxypeptidase [Traorella sp.]